MCSSTECTFNDEFKLRVEFFELGPKQAGVGALVRASRAPHVEAFLHLKVSPHIYIHAPPPNKVFQKGVWTPPELHYTNCCFTACVVYALLRSKVGKTKLKNATFHRKPGASLQLRNAIEQLGKVAGIDLNKKAGEPEWVKIQGVLGRRAHLRVYYDYQKLDLIWAADHRQGLEIKILVQRDRKSGSFHAHYFENLRRLGGWRQQCEFCEQLYNRFHKCRKTCPFCKDKNIECAKYYVNYTACDKCRRVFRNKICFDLHVKNLTCGELYVCDRCSRTVERKEKKNHWKTCNVVVCDVCKVKLWRKQLRAHRCRIQPGDREQWGVKKRFKTVCYDVETFRDESGYHVPYCVTAIISCEKCIDDENYEKGCLDNCGHRARWFYMKHPSDNVGERFCKWLFYSSDTAPAKGGGCKTVAMAFNAAGEIFAIISSHSTNLSH